MDVPGVVVRKELKSQPMAPFANRSKQAQWGGREDTFHVAHVWSTWGMQKADAHECEAQW